MAHEAEKTVAGLLQERLEAMSIPELESLKDAAQRRLFFMRQKGERMRRDLEQQAKAAGLSVDDIDALFG